MLRNLKFVNFLRPLPNLRFQSSSAADGSSDHVKITINNDGFSTLTMASKPVNSLSLGFLKDFCSKMDTLENEKVKGVVLTSSLKNVFCAGLHLHELIRPDEARVNAFWQFFQEAWLKLHGSSLPTVALINGHAIAGGCVFALSCEYRVMMREYKIGLNETVVGIVPPQFVNAVTRSAMSTRQGEIALTSGTLYTADEALKLGMIDEIADNEDEAMEKCLKFLHAQAKIPALGRGLTKQSYRKPELDLVRDPKIRSRDSKIFIDHILRPSTQKILIDYVEGLKANKK